MMVKFPLLVIGSLVGISVLMSAYGQDKKVPASQCPQVIEHVKFVQGGKSPGQAALMAECKVASDEERGCLMAASTRVQLAQCFR
ncbi:hypothetical protein [Shewanella sp. GXUN23E]|uniref:hypothetical protein n=1 Tax=Shewanella sp. GXUN23E TaxID=3422498 RepID=UPI003D7D8F16